MIYYKKNLHIKKQKKNWKFRINGAIASSYMSRASCSLLLPSMVAHQLYVIKSSSQLKGAIQAVIEFVTKRGHELVKIDVSRFSYLKISVVLKNFRILELCVYLLLFKKKKKKKKLWMQLCVYLLISRLLYFLVRLVIYCQQNNPIFALCYGYVTEKHLRLETLCAVSFFHLDSLTCLLL